MTANGLDQREPNTNLNNVTQKVNNHSLNAASLRDGQHVCGQVRQCNLIGYRSSVSTGHDNVHSSGNRSLIHALQKQPTI